MTKQNRTGTVYLLTLASAVVLVALVLGLSIFILPFRRSTRSDTDSQRAQIYAELGIRHALFVTTQLTNWRQILSNGNWLVNIPAEMPDADKEKIRHTIDTVFKTDTGRKIAAEIFLTASAAK